MKIALSLLSLLAAAQAFAPLTAPRVASTTTLHVAGGIRPAQDDQDYFAQKPLHSKVSSESVPVKKVTIAERNKMQDVLIDEDYWLTWAVALLCPLIIWYHPSYSTDGSPSLIGVAGGLFHLLFAALLWVQTRRVRCVFEKDGFEFYNIKGPKLDLEQGAWLERKPDNYVAGTHNRWQYDKIINYGFFPSLDFPVICYFKETQTPEWKWNRWFAAFDSYGRGQPHFFPGICSARQFKAEMEKRGVKRKPVPTLKDQ